jgi:hypothetical protein
MPSPEQATRVVVTERGFAHARKTRSGTEVLVRQSGAFCHVVLERAEARRWRLFSRSASEAGLFPRASPALQGSADRPDDVASDNADGGRA